MTGRLSILSLCVLFSFPTQAGFVEFAQWIPWKFVTQELRKAEISHTLMREELPLTIGEFRPVFRNLRFDLRGIMEEIKFSPAGLSLSGAGSFSLTIDAISVDQIITREFGGNVLQVHVKAECDPIRIEVGQFGLESIFNISSGLPALENVRLNIPSQGWSVSPVSCSGISQLSEEIAGKIRHHLSSPGSMSLLIRQWAAPVLDEWMEVFWPALTSGDQWQNVSPVSFDETGVLLAGELLLSGSDEVELPEILPPELKSDLPRFFISREGMTALMKDRLRKHLPLVYDLRENQSFRKLMGSRLLQYLVWPELRRFHPNTPMVLRTDPSTLRLSISGNEQPMNAKVSGSWAIVTVIGGAPIDYLTTQLQLSVPVNMNLLSGKLSLVTGKANATVTLKVSPLYRMLYSPDEKVPSSLISRAVASMLSDKAESVQLPTLVVGDREFRLSNLKFHQQLVTMDWL